MGREEYDSWSNQMQQRRLDLRQVKNTGCPAKSTSDQVPSALDQLPARCVGDWSYDKIYRLVRYFGIFTQGMKKKWEGLNYVEICSGPGRCVIRGENIEIDGTALAIINHPIFKLLKRAVFIDNDQTVVDALNKRIKNLNASEKAAAEVGDYTDSDVIVKILDSMQSGCLNLCFIDPTHCDVPFQTVAQVSEKLGKADFIINVALGTDVARNIVSAVLDSNFAKARQKYEAFLGSGKFFEREDVKSFARAHKHDELRRAFIAEYLASLKNLGLTHSDEKPVKHYYHLLFVSGSPKGLEFWRKACEIGPDDQRELPMTD